LSFLFFLSHPEAFFNPVQIPSANQYLYQAASALSFPKESFPEEENPYWCA
jgi:hypothetical protein